MTADDPRRRLPRVDAVLGDARLDGWPRDLARQAAREVLEGCRGALAAGEVPAEDVVATVLATLEAWTRPQAQVVINATGVVLHTNLGRAPWPPEAVQAAADVAGAYTDLEVRRADGARGGRLDGVRDKLIRLTGAEDALVVNNNAAAVLLALTALARDRDVVVSRGELVEIGGSFRVPDVIASGGARLVAVGTTNRTRRADYAAAIGPHTAVLLQVHTSNFRMEGFVARASTDELVGLARGRELAVVVDQGSGAWVDAGEEPGVREAVAAGADVVTFSTDKLLGGPQAGALVGRAAVVARLRAHPLYRALRLDKTLLAGLDATLGLHLRERATPAQRMMAMGPDEAVARCEAWRAHLGQHGVPSRVVPVQGRVGGGAMPEHPLPGAALALDHPRPLEVAAALLRGDPAVFVRVHDGAVLCDPRTVFEAQDPALLGRLASVAGSG